MGRLLFVVFLVVPLIEIALFILLGQAIGILPTLLGVLITAIVGAVVVRAQGLSLIAEIRETMGRGALPARAIADAMMVAIAGVLLLTPGYFTDFTGLLLLVPPVRTVIYRALSSRMTPFTVPSRGQGRRNGSDDDTIDLDGDAWRPR